MGGSPGFRGPSRNEHTCVHSGQRSSASHQPSTATAPPASVRERLIGLATIRTVAERVGTVSSRLKGVHAFLPRDDEELPQVRAYLGWLEFWRVRGEPGGGLSREIGHLRALLRAAAGPALDPAWHEATDALVHGLLHATCRPAATLSVQEAHAVLAAFLGAVTKAEP